MNYSRSELEKLGLKKVGKNVTLAKTCVIINPQNISIGDNSRIDVFVILSAGKEGIEIGRNTHIAAGTYIFGNGGRVVISDFCSISSHCALYTASDDFVEGHLSNPTVPEKFKKLTTGPIVFENHSGSGCGSVFLPNVTLKTGAVVGALTLIRKDVPEYTTVGGNPARKICERDKNLLLKLEKEYLEYERENS